MGQVPIAVSFANTEPQPLGPSLTCFLLLILLWELFFKWYLALQTPASKDPHLFDALLLLRIMVLSFGNGRILNVCHETSESSYVLSSYPWNIFVQVKQTARFRQNQNLLCAEFRGFQQGWSLQESKVGSWNKGLCFPYCQICPNISSLHTSSNKP